MSEEAPRSDSERTDPAPSFGGPTAQRPREEHGLGSRSQPYVAALSDTVTSRPGDRGEAEVDEFVAAEISPGAASIDRQRRAPGSFASRPRTIARRRGLPLVLLVLTVISTFVAGATQWMPFLLLQMDSMLIRRALVAHWQDGLIYAACVLGILLTHEMGHFLATVYYRIPASFPFCIPFPISPIGTLGAVIAMDGRQADRREMFDIGLAGPLAGLVVAIPVMWMGIQQLDLRGPAPAAYSLESPLGVRMVLDEIQPPGYRPGQRIPNSRLNPFFMAGWVGLLITGLNMLPVSQLDGGHVIYALLGKKAHWIARGLIVLAIAWSVYNEQPTWVLMIALVLLIGTDHPPTRDDKAPLGWFRIGLGIASLIIPFLCFSPTALTSGMGG